MIRSPLLLQSEAGARGFKGRPQQGAARGVAPQVSVGLDPLCCCAPQPGRVVIDPKVVRNKAQHAVTPRKFLARMLHNLKQVYISNGEPHNTLAVVRYLRCVPLAHTARPALTSTRHKRHAMCCALTCVYRQLLVHLLQSVMRSLLYDVPRQLFVGPELCTMSPAQGNSARPGQ